MNLVSKPRNITPKAYPKMSSSTKLVDLGLKKPEEKPSLNSNLISVLDRYATQLSVENKSVEDRSLRTKNNFRIRSIRKAIDALKDHDQEIRSGDQAKQLKGIGQGIADRIDIILSTGTLPELGEVEESSESKAVDSLITINGIGEKTALRFYRDYGIRSAEDLIKRWKEGTFKVEKHKLTHHIEIGLKYYDAFNVRIPREEIDDFYPQLDRMIEEIDPSNQLVYEIAGSYRRKKATSGDVDILLSHRELKTKEDLEKSKENYLNLLLEKLMDTGMLVDHLDNDVNTYYKGVIVLKSIPRRIDIMIIPYNTYASALLHNTGSGPFNQRLRAHAMKKGYHLSQHGLYKVVRGKKESEPIPTLTEQEIFSILGVKYLKPEERD